MPAKLDVELKGAIELRKKADQTVRDLQGEPMLNAMRDCTMMVTRTARKEAKVDRGLHRANIVPAISVVGNTIEGVVGTNLAYGPMVILDTKPHFPPLEPIRQWVRRHGMEAGAAFIIARKIARKGTKGDRSLQKGIELNHAAIIRRLSRAVNEAVNK